MIMVAEHREDPVAGAQLSHQCCAWGGIATLLRNIVSGKRNQIGIEIVRDFDRPFEVSGINQRAVMKIGKVDYAQTAQVFRPASQVNFLTLDGRHKWFSQSD